MVAGQESGPDALMDGFGMLNGGGLLIWLRIMAIEMGSAVENKQQSLLYGFEIIILAY